MGEQQIDTGDSVLHLPTGETWLVACVDGDDLSWCGWPEGRARLSDCTLVRKATPDQRMELLTKLAESKVEGHRKQHALTILGMRP